MCLPYGTTIAKLALLRPRISLDIADRKEVASEFIIRQIFAIVCKIFREINVTPWN